MNYISINLSINSILMFPKDENAIILFIVIILLWIFDFVMKWIALYRAWTRKEVTRFIFLFLLNTLWILPIIYLLTHKKVED